MRECSCLLSKGGLNCKGRLGTQPVSGPAQFKPTLFQGRVYIYPSGDGIYRPIAFIRFSKQTLPPKMLRAILEMRN